MKEIKYPLVESKRPPLYTSMKYWGKKPHNIWNTYINNYTKDGVYLDPFAGSGMSAFEAALSRKKCIALDLNPLTSFIIEVVSSKFDNDKFKAAVESIISILMKDETYKKLYLYRNSDVIVHNIKWNDKEIYEVCTESLDGKIRNCLTPQKLDYEASELINYSNIKFEYPNYEFREEVSFSSSFRKQIGTSYEKLFTPRNLYVLSFIFDLILKVEDEIIKKQLLFGFIQTVHLSTKMCVPRGKSSKRDFSTSWGRSAYIASKKQMEMNPLLVFENSCFGKQSVQSVMRYAMERYHNKLIIKDINNTNFNINDIVDIWYGVVDAKTISSIIPENSIEFILTDPPYGGLVQYLDLSSIWLAWLVLYDNKYQPLYELELTVGKKKTENDFANEFSVTLKELHRVLKNDGKIVITFNNKKIETWASLISAIYNANFVIEEVIHQPNKRSGESNVDDPNGVSSSDYYIRCIKGNKKLRILNELELKELCSSIVFNIILDRNEPTPYQILFNAYINKVASNGVVINAQICSLDNILQENKDKLIITENSLNRAGKYYWIKNKKYNKDSKTTLSNKLKHYLITLLDENEVSTFEFVLEKIYKKFNGNLSIDIETIKAFLSEIAIIKGDLILRRNENA